MGLLIEKKDQVIWKNQIDTSNFFWSKVKGCFNQFLKTPKEEDVK